MWYALIFFFTETKSARLKTFLCDFIYFCYCTQDPQNIQHQPAGSAGDLYTVPYSKQNKQKIICKTKETSVDAVKNHIKHTEDEMVCILIKLNHELNLLNLLYRIQTQFNVNLQFQLVNCTLLLNQKN